MSELRLPLLDPAPLLRALELRDSNPHRLALALGEDDSNIYRTLEKPLAWWKADLYASALELHPANLWGDEWWAVEEAREAQRQHRLANARRNYHRRRTDPPRVHESIDA